ncbi:unnamed protein product [Cuscuta epithymum]|uniref:Serpin domain-containing protein n=1 Tax=Cuscuta epithymum TaxID=186058 RepID=A0AAV0D0K3_9ASTE|nr:unnamed protein product [Cuscuta epithymum]
MALRRSNRKRKIDMDAVSDEFIAAQTDSSLLFAKHVFSDLVKADSNLVFSPLSINILLGMAAAGYTGQTRRSLLSFLKSDSTADFDAFAFHILTNILADASHLGGPSLSAANSVWVEQTLSLKPCYKDLLEKSYDGVSQSVDFRFKASEAVDAVNLWFDKKTGGLIKNVLDKSAVTPRTSIILANALYFKGDWSEKFNEKCTKDRKFFLMNGKSVKVPFMSSGNRQYVKAFDDFKILSLPYKRGTDMGRQFSMYFVLPNEKDGLSSLMDSITKEPGFLERHAPDKQVKVGAFFIPKFKITFELDVLSVLEKLGVRFPPNGLDEMVVDPQEKLVVSNIIHKCVVDVNEKGTKAAATTRQMLLVGCARYTVVEEKIDFVADHPFAFFIREDVSGVVTFVGTVLNPLL